MSSEINAMKSAESEHLLSGNAVQLHVYGSKKSDVLISTMTTDGKKDQSQTLPQYMAALAATGGAFAAGTTLGWSSPAEDYMVNVTSIEPEYKFEITKENFAWISSLVPLGAALVCLVIGTIIQKIGRKATMLLLVIPFTVGWVLVTFATNIFMLFIGRFILGVSGGAFCVAAPTYTGEIAESRIRGSLGSYFQLMLVIGVVFSYIVGSNANLFVLNLICAIIPLIFGVVFMFMPETPSFLISNGKNDDAAKSLKWLRGSDYDYSSELAELQNQYEAEKKNKVSLTAALSRRSTLKAILISLGLMFFQQMSGINAIIFYTKNIFGAAKTNIDNDIAAIIVGIMQVIAVFVSSMIVDKAGRRLLLLPSAIVMTICSILLGVYFIMADINKDSVSSFGWLPIASLCVFIILFSLGFGPIPWMMIGELFSNDIKGVAGSAAGAFNWGLAFLITSTFSPISDAVGKGATFLIFAGFCFFGVLFTYCFVPETKGKSLADIQRMLEGEKVLQSDNEHGNTTSDSKF